MHSSYSNVRSIHREGVGSLAPGRRHSVVDVKLAIYAVRLHVSSRAFRALGLVSIWLSALRWTFHVANLTRASQGTHLLEHCKVVIE